MRYEDNATLKTDVSGWVCKTCNRFYGNNEHLARWCCAKDLPCPTDGCGGRVSKPWSHCEECRDKADQRRLKDRAEKERRRLEAAEIVEYCGPFFVDDRFYNDLDQYLDDCVCDDVEPEEWAFVPLALSPALDTEGILRDLLERMELMDDSGCGTFSFAGAKELDAAIKKFNEANKNNYYYEDGCKQRFRIKE